jgi:hypothetical protein
MAEQKNLYANLAEYLKNISDQNSYILNTLDDIADNTKYISAIDKVNKENVRLAIETKKAVTAKIQQQEKRATMRARVTQLGRELDKQARATIRLMKAKRVEEQKLLASKVAVDIAKTRAKEDLEIEKRRNALDILESKKEVAEQKRINNEQFNKEKLVFTEFLFSERKALQEQKQINFREKEDVIRETAKFKTEVSKGLIDYRKEATLAAIPEAARIRAEAKTQIKLKEREGILEAVKSIGPGHALTTMPEFLEFLKKQEKNATQLLLGNQADQLIGMEMLKTLKQLRIDQKDNIDKLIKEQQKARRKPFEDSMKELSTKGGLRGAVGTDLMPLARGITDIKWMISGVRTLMSMPIISTAVSGLLIAVAGAGGYALGSYLNDKLGISKWAADTFAGKLEVGKQVLTREEEASNLRIQARDELIREYSKKLDDLSIRTDLSEDKKIRLRSDLQKQIGVLYEERKRLHQRGAEPVADSGIVLEKQREIGARLRAKTAPAIPIDRSEIQIPTSSTGATPPITVSVGVPEEITEQQPIVAPVEISAKKSEIRDKKRDIGLLNPTNRAVLDIYKNLSKEERVRRAKEANAVIQNQKSMEDIMRENRERRQPTTVINNTTQQINNVPVPVKTIPVYIEPN